MSGITLDTGALIAIERRRERVLRLLRWAKERRRAVTVPMAAVVEWWRGRTDVREAMLTALLVEPMSLSVAQAAGEALAAVRGASAIDAIVMASAALRGDIVWTSDIDDLTRLSSHFPEVRLLAV